MSPPTATRPDPTAADGPPPGDAFWTRYNAHFEFPIGTALSVLAHVLVAAVLVFVLVGLMSLGADKKPVSVISLGDGPTGDGTTTPGGVEHAVGGPGPSPADPAVQPPELEAVRKDIATQFRLDDPTEDWHIPDAMAAAYEKLDEQLRQKLLGTHAKGNGPGPKPGEPGTRSDSTRARGLRWVLRFSTRSGQDYLNQLKALKAVVMIPVPPKNEKMIYLRDLASPQVNVYATDADIAEQAGKIQFQDVRPASNAAIQEALGLPFTPSVFIAFFPKELEEEMARKEIGFQNKRSADIKETVFQVIVSGGRARLHVVHQALK